MVLAVANCKLVDYGSVAMAGRCRRSGSSTAVLVAIAAATASSGPAKRPATEG